MKTKSRAHRRVVVSLLQYSALFTTCRVAWSKWLLGHTVIIDAPLLLESGPFLPALCCPIIVVTSPQEMQVSRLMNRDKVTVQEAVASIAAQMSTAARAARADVVITNDSTPDALTRQVDLVWGAIVGHQRYKARDV